MSSPGSVSIEAAPDGGDGAYSAGDFEAESIGYEQPIEDDDVVVHDQSGQEASLSELDGGQTRFIVNSGGEVVDATDEVRDDLRRLETMSPEEREKAEENPNFWPPDRQLGLLATGKAGEAEVVKSEAGDETADGEPKELMHAATAEQEFFNGSKPSVEQVVAHQGEESSEDEQAPEEDDSAEIDLTTHEEEAPSQEEQKKLTQLRERTTLFVSKFANLPHLSDESRALINQAQEVFNGMSASELNAFQREIATTIDRDYIKAVQTNSGFTQENPNAPSMLGRAAKEMYGQIDASISRRLQEALERKKGKQ